MLMAVFISFVEATALGRAKVDVGLLLHELGMEKVLPSEVHMDNEVGITLAFTWPVIEVNCHACLASSLAHGVPPVRSSQFPPLI